MATLLLTNFIIKAEKISKMAKSKLSQGISALLESPITEVSTAVFDSGPLALELIQASATNPRKHFDGYGLEDLSKSMAKVGLLQPITVRPIGDRYEIIAGERRYRAANILKWKTIPAIVRQVTDEEVLEIQIIENLQREDVSPMDEAKAFQSLLKKESIDWLCSRIHKSKKYVTDRLKLNDLIEEGQRLVQSGVLPLSHAIMISKLPETEQTKCLEKCIEDDWQRDRDKEVCTFSTSKLREFIDNSLMVDLDKVTFSLESEDLLPEAGSCMNCPKRTCNQNLLFQEITADDKCTDPTCFHKKVSANIDLALKTAKEQYGKQAVASGAVIPYSSNTIKVKGLNVQFTDTKKKTVDQVAVVITKGDGFNRQSLGKTVYVDKAALEKAATAKEERKSSGTSGRYDHAAAQKENFMKIEFPKLQQIVALLQGEEIKPAEAITKIFLEEQFNYHIANETMVAFAGLMGVYPSAIPEELFQVAQDIAHEPMKALQARTVEHILKMPIPHQLVVSALLWSLENNWDVISAVLNPVPPRRKRK
jgi:ParB/RepB/Spo0J family partition protein